jgi:hypothetical protein
MLCEASRRRFISSRSPSTHAKDLFRYIFSQVNPQSFFSSTVIRALLLLQILQYDR